MAVFVEVDGKRYALPHEVQGDEKKIRSYLASKKKDAPGLSKSKIDAVFERPDRESAGGKPSEETEAGPGAGATEEE